MDFPIEVSDIECKEFNMRGLRETGTLVRIRPCAEEYGDKTYLGIYLGDLPLSPVALWNRESKVLSLSAHTNPAIYVFDLKKIIWGCDSWWAPVKDPTDLDRLITDETIDNVWYVKLAKEMARAAEEKGDG